MIDTILTIIALVAAAATGVILALNGRGRLRVSPAVVATTAAIAVVAVPMFVNAGDVAYNLFAVSVVGSAAWTAVRILQAPEAGAGRPAPGPTPSPRPNPSPRPVYPDVVEVRPGMPDASISIEMVTATAAEVCGIPRRQIGRPAIIHRVFGAYRMVIAPGSPGCTPDWLEQAARAHADAWNAQYIDLTETTR